LRREEGGAEGISMEMGKETLKNVRERWTKIVKAVCIKENFEAEKVLN
jgi:hypothetical protein